MTYPDQVDLEAAEQARWAYRSTCYRALNLTFGIRSEEADVGAYLDHALTGLRSREEEKPEVWYSVARSSEGSERPYVLHFGSELVGGASSKAFAIEMLLWHLNAATVERAAPLVVLHAGGVVINGRGVIISGSTGSGKSTLTAALVRAGAGYLTDEALAIDPQNGVLHPYPKALTIQRGSWRLLGDLRPPPSELSPRAWHVAPADIRPDAIAGPTPASLALFPTYEGSAPARWGASMQKIAGAEALIELLQQSFEQSAAVVPTLQVIARTLESCTCFRVSTVDIDLAVGRVMDLVAS
jgi:hypothetical protein